MITDSSVSSEEITINAPAKLVWEVMLDFDNYGEWNEFCPEIIGHPVEGATLEMQVDLGSGLQTQVEKVTKVDAPRTIVWSMDNQPGDPIHADRIQSIEPIDENSCRYTSVDEFSGEAVPQMLEMLGKQVEDGFNLCARGLKARAESLHQGSAS